MNHKHEALWLLKNCKLYILCTLILFNAPHLTIGSRLILIQSELREFQNVVVQILIFLLVFHSYDILGVRMLWKPKEARILKNF